MSSVSSAGFDASSARVSLFRWLAPLFSCVVVFWVCDAFVGEGRDMVELMNSAVDDLHVGFLISRI